MPWWGWLLAGIAISFTAAIAIVWRLFANDQWK